MIKFAPPVRFIATILTLWIGCRVIFWTPANVPRLLIQSPNPFLPGLPALPLPGEFSLGERNDAHSAPEARRVAAPVGPLRQPTSFDLTRAFAASTQPHAGGCGASCTRMLLAAHIPPLSQPMLMRFARRQSRIPPHGQSHSQPIPFVNPGTNPRFSLSAWAQWRSGDGVNALVNDGELGGSQAGVRARYRVTSGAGVEAAVAARLSRPIERSGGAEVGIGIALRPSQQIPIELTAERRIALDGGGRDAWSLGVAGGLYRRPLPMGLELDGYVQAGIVGARRRDLYGDAALVVSRPIPISERSTLSLGGGIWAGAQPGVSRVDIGPEASLRLPAGDGGVRLSVSWRQRVAGSAAPGSGPVLTLGTDF